MEDGKQAVGQKRKRAHDPDIDPDIQKIWGTQSSQIQDEAGVLLGMMFRVLIEDTAALPREKELLIDQTLFLVPSWQRKLYLNFENCTNSH